MTDITILQGDVVEQLRTLPDCSVQCVVTSPPYYGLRAYSTTPQIWIDGPPLCDNHDWTKTPPRRSRKVADVKDQESKQASSAGTMHELSETDICQTCGAWRGELGMEPTPELFVKHIVSVFSEVKRVLRDDGVLWINFGDSYWGGKGQSAHGDPERHIARLAAGKTINQPHQEIGKPGETLNKDGKHPVIKPKDMIGIPWMVAFALRADGWYLRSDIIWSKPNPMPESVTDRPTKAHEYVFLLTKKAKYYYDADAIREPHITQEDRPDGIMRNRLFMYDSKENLLRPKNLNRVEGVHNMHKAREMARHGTNIPGHSGNYNANGECILNPNGRNRRTVWEIATQPTPDAHFATFPEALVEPCIKAGSKIGDTILDPFGGSGTTAKVARDLKRDCILIELNPAYVKIMRKKLRLNEQLVV